MPLTLKGLKKYKIDFSCAKFSFHFIIGYEVHFTFPLKVKKEVEKSKIHKIYILITNQSNFNG